MRSPTATQRLPSSSLSSSQTMPAAEAPAPVSTLRLTRTNLQRVQVQDFYPDTCNQCHGPHSEFFDEIIQPPLTPTCGGHDAVEVGAHFGLAAAAVPNPNTGSLSTIEELCCGGGLLDDMKESIMSIHNEMTKNFIESGTEYVEKKSARSIGNTIPFRKTPSYSNSLPACRSSDIPAIVRSYSAPDSPQDCADTNARYNANVNANGIAIANAFNFDGSPPPLSAPTPEPQRVPDQTTPQTRQQHLPPNYSPYICSTAPPLSPPIVRTFSSADSVSSSHSVASSVTSAASTATSPRTVSRWLERATRRIEAPPLGTLSKSILDEVGRVMNGWAKRRSRKSALVVERLLKRVIDEKEYGNVHAVATTAMYNMVIDGWAKSGDPVASKRAEDILQLMTEQHSKGNEDVRPDTISFNSVLNAWSKSGNASRAEEILRHMDQLWRDGNSDVKPNVRSYNSVIDAWAKSGMRGAAERAEELLASMEKLYLAGNEDVRPTDISFNAVINAWAKSGERGAAQRAEEILKRMDDLYKSGNDKIKPNVRSFNVVIDAWAKCTEKGAASRAGRILDWMEILYLAGNKDVKPDTISFNAVIDAYAKSSDPHKAEGILIRMEVMQRTGDKVRLNTRSFNSVLNAWARSRHTGAAERCKSILERMKALYEGGNLECRPDVFSYTTVMSACAYTFGTREEQSQALGLAFRVFDELRECEQYGSPDAVTYSTLLKACRHLAQPGDEQMRSVEYVFNFCCADGLLGEKITKQMQEIIPLDFYRSLTRGEINPQNLPFDWSRNVINVRRNSGWNGNGNGNGGGNRGGGNYNGRKDRKKWNR